jgi:phage-related protein
MLITLATQGSHIPGLNIQPAAINELKQRRDPQIPHLLAGLITTSSPLDTRKAAAEALRSFRCDTACTQLVLVYLRNVHDGQLNVEERTLNAVGSSLNESVRETLDSEQKEIYRQLYECLMKDPSTTNSVLADSFGLGSSKVAPFAIDFITQVLDKSACPYLVRSLQLLDDPKAGQAQLERAFEQLNCQR